MTGEIVATSIIVVAVVLVRIGAARVIRKRGWATLEEGRRWLVMVRNLTLLAAAFAIVIVWAEELRTVAFSLVAFLVAFVWAASELIKSASASIIRANTGSFTIGDRIHIGDIRGEVIDHSLMQTQLLEIGRGHIRTGRVVSIPNGRFLTEPVFNESRGHRFILHSFTVPVARNDWRRSYDELMAAATELSAPYIEEARVQMEARARRYSVSAPIVEPFIFPKPTGVDAVDLLVRVPVTAADIWRVERDIITRWLEQYDGRESAPAEA